MSDRTAISVSEESHALCEKLARDKDMSIRAAADELIRIGAARAKALEDFAKKKRQSKRAPKKKPRTKRTAGAEEG
jgi:hypothetical protein